MRISFTAMGLSLEAQVNVRPGRRGTYLEPPESTEVEFLDLTCEGKEASFLLDSAHCFGLINEAALEAVEEYAHEARVEAAEARAELHREEAMFR